MSLMHRQNGYVMNRDTIIPGKTNQFKWVELILYMANEYSILFRKFTFHSWI